MPHAAVFQFLHAVPAEPPTLRRSLEDIDWAELVRDSGRHGLAGVLQREVKASGLALPHNLSATLQEEALAIAALGLRMKALLFRVLDALASHGVSPVLLKGYGLASRLYSEPLIRPTSDIDLLIRPHEFSNARAVLFGLGFQAMRPSSPRPNPLLGEEGKVWGHEESFVGLGGLVELHWRPMSGFGTGIAVGGALRRSRSDQLEGRSVRYLSFADEIAFLATHAAKHLLERLLWLFDLKLLIRKSVRVNWDLVAQVASDNRVNGPVYLALEAAHRACGAEVPREVLQELMPRNWRYHRAAKFLFSDRRLLAASFAHRKYATHLTRVLLASDSQTMTAAALSLADQARQKFLGRLAQRVIQKLFPSTQRARV